MCGGVNELRRSLGLVFGNREARVQSRLHRQPCPEIDHAENFVDDLVGVTRAGPPGGRLKIVAGDGVDDDFSRRGIEFVPEFVNAAGVGLVGDHNDRGDAPAPERTADDFEFILSVDDGGIQDVNRFCGNTLAAKHLIVAIGFAGIKNAEFGELLRLRAGAGQPDFCGVTIVVKGCGFEGARGEIATEDGDGAGLVQRILFDQPVADAQQERETGGKREESERAEDGEDTERVSDEVVGAS